MPLAPQNHPDPHELAQYNLGKLSDDETIQIEDHVAECEACARTVLGLPGDTFLDSLRRGATTGSQVAETRRPAISDAASSPTAPEQVSQSPDFGATMLFDESVRRVLELPAELRQHSRYQIQECLGVGGMGSVYKAQHRLMNRPVALKVINPQLLNHSGAAQRFHREVQAAARLSHPNIVTAHDADETGGLHFLVMEYVEGIDLHQVIRERGKLEIRESCEYIRQAALGLQHAHEQGMVHRDIKPHNLMVVGKRAGDKGQESGGQTPVVKILDFGLANFASDMAVEEFVESVASASAPQLTMLGSMMGTPDYIAPEQASDAHSVDIRADIYSLGCTFYCLLAGRAPFHEGSVLDKIAAHTAQEAPSLSTLRDDVPAEVEAIVQKMMAKNPAERYQTPQEVADAVGQAMQVISQSTPSARRPRSRRPGLVALALGSLAVLAGVILLLTSDGTLEVRTEVEDVDVVISQGGEEIELKDLATGSTVKRLANGTWDIKLKGNRNDVKLDKSRFTLSRWGKATVTITRKEAGPIAEGSAPESSEALRSNVETLLADAVLALDFSKDHFYTKRRQSWIRDLSGKGNDVAARGELARFSTEGPTRGSVVLDAKGSLELPHRLIAAGKPFTIAAWVHRQLPWDQGDPLVFAQRNADATSELSCGLGIVDGQWMLNVVSAEAYVHDPFGEDAEKARNFARWGDWGFVAWTRNAEGKLSFTVDGQTEQTQHSDLGEEALHDHIIIGRGLDGGLDELAVFNRALSATELRTLYAWGKRGRALSESLKPAGSQNDAPSIQLSKTLPGHVRAGGGECLSLSRDGTVLASCGGDGARIWEMPAGTLMVHLPRQKGGATNVALSPDGKLAAVSEYEINTIFLWELPAGKLLGTFPSELENVVRLQFSPDGKWLAEAGDKAVSVWDVAQKKMVSQYKAELFFEPLCFTPDGKSLLIGANRMLWDIESGAARMPIPAGSGLWAVHLSADGSVLAGSVDNQIILWDLRTSRQLASMIGHQDVIESIRFLPGEQHMISGSRDGTLRIWDVKTGKEVARREGVRHLANHVVPLPDGRSAVSFGAWYPHEPPDREKSDWSVQVWTLPETVWPSTVTPATEPIVFDRKFTGHTGAVKSVAFSPDGTYIASASGFPHSDGTIRLWDVKLGAEVRQFKGQAGPIQSLCFSHSGQWLLTGGGDKTLRLWDVATGDLLKTLEGHEGSIESVGFSPDDKFAVSGSVATGGIDHTARSWDLATGKEIARFTGHKLHVHGVAVIDETRAISVDRMGAGYIWRMDNGQLLKRLSVRSTESNSAYALALSPDRSQAIIGYQDHAIRIWDLNTGEILQTFSTKISPVMSVCMSADGRFVLAGGGATGDTKIAVEVFDVASGQRVTATEPMEGTTWSIALAPDGRHVLSAGGATWKSEEGFVPNGDNDIYLWKLPESLWPEYYGPIPRLTTLQGHSDPIGGLTWLLDGNRAVSYSGAEGVVRMWDIASGKTQWTTHTEAGGDGVGAVAIAPHGETIAVGDAHGSIHLLDTKDGKSKGSWKSHEGGIASVAFSPDGEWLGAVSTKAGPAKVWEVATKTLISTRDDGPDAYAVTFTGDGLFMLTGGRSFMTRRIEVDSQGVKGFAGSGSGGDVPVHSVAATKDGTLAAYGQGDGGITIRRRTGSVEKTNIGYFSVENWATPRLHQGPVTSLAFTADGRHLISGGLPDPELRPELAQASLIVWDVATRQPVLQQRSKSSIFQRLVLSSDGRTLLTASSTAADRDHRLHVWRLPEQFWPKAAITIMLMKDGQFFIDDWATNDIAEFMQRLKALLEEYPEREVSINSAQPLGIAPVQQLATLARQVGAKQVRFPEWVGPMVDPKEPSPFFAALGDLQGLVRKTVADEGLNVREIAPAEKDVATVRSQLVLRAEVRGEEDRGGKLLTALRNSLKTVSTQSAAFISGIETDKRGAVSGETLTYQTLLRDGIVRLEMEPLSADKRMPKIKTWSLIIRVEEWPKTDATEPEAAVE